MTEMHYRADIQGLRALAVTAVVAYHASFGLPYGYLGVDAFLVLSGYVVGGVIVREIDESGSFGLRRFLFRRFWRLYPNLLLMVTFSLGLFLLLSSSRQLRSLLVQGIAAISGVSNFYYWRRSQDYFALGDGAEPLLHTWSLSLEEQFYLILGIAILLLLWLKRRISSRLTRGSVLIFVIAVVLISILIGTIVVFSFGVDSVLFSKSEFYLPFGRAWQFLLGIACYLRFGNPKKRWNPVFVVSTIIGAFLLMGPWTPWQVSDGVGVGIRRLLLSLLVAGLLSRQVGSVLGNSLLGWIGTRSYGIYLWHYPILTAAAVVGWFSIAGRVIAIAVSVSLAAISFRIVEAPLRQRSRATAYEPTSSFQAPDLKRRRRLGWIATATAAVLIIISIDPVKYFVKQPASTKDYSLEIQQYLLGQGCRGSEIGEVDCGDDLSGTVLLLGDSHAWSLAPGFVTAAENLRIPFAVRTFPGCLALPSSDYVHASSSCESWREELRREIDQESPQVVLLMMCARLSEGCPEGVTKRGISRLVDVAAQSISENFPPQTKFSVADPMPLLLSDPDSNDSILAKLFSGDTDFVVVNRAKMQHAHAFQDRLTAEIASRSFRVDNGRPIFDQLCTQSKCRVRDSSLQENLFKDSNHLSLQGSLRTVAKLKDLLQELWLPER